MTNRERFRRVMSYQPVDRVPVMVLEPYEPTALERWRREGLPDGVEPADFLGMSRLVPVPVSFHPIPGFSSEVLSEDETYAVRRTAMGALRRERKDNPTLFYGHIDHPVKTRADWEAYRERFRAGSPGRLADDWRESVAPGLDASDEPVVLYLYPFFFRLGFYAMGMERFLTAFYEDPALLHDIFAYWSEFVLQIIRPLLGTVQIDCAIFTEDLAGKNGPLVSPAIYDEFWRPHQAAILQALQGHGVPLICQWTAGQVEPLLPTMLAQGFNCTWPLEVIAGMDAGSLRERFGQGLRLGGNIAKEAVIAGPEQIDAEIDRLLHLIQEGGFIPALDDMASPDMPFAHFRHLIERLQAIRLG